MPVAHQPPAAIIGELVGMAAEQAPKPQPRRPAPEARAPLRKTSVSGSVKVPGCESWKTLGSVTAYHSFAGEVPNLQVADKFSVEKSIEQYPREGNGGRQAVKSLRCLLTDPSQFDILQIRPWLAGTECNSIS